MTLLYRPSMRPLIPSLVWHRQHHLYYFEFGRYTSLRLSFCPQVVRAALNEQLACMKIRKSLSQTGSWNWNSWVGRNLEFHSCKRHLTEVRKDETNSAVLHSKWMLNKMSKSSCTRALGERTYSMITQKNSLADGWRLKWLNMPLMVQKQMFSALE